MSQLSQEDRIKILEDEVLNLKKSIQPSQDRIKILEDEIQNLKKIIEKMRTIDNEPMIDIQSTTNTQDSTDKDPVRCGRCWNEGRINVYGYDFYCDTCEWHWPPNRVSRNEDED